MRKKNRLETTDKEVSKSFLQRAKSFIRVELYFTMYNLCFCLGKKTFLKKLRHHESLAFGSDFAPDYSAKPL